MSHFCVHVKQYSKTLTFHNDRTLTSVVLRVFRKNEACISFFFVFDHFLFYPQIWSGSSERTPKKKTTQIQKLLDDIGHIAGNHQTSSLSPSQKGKIIIFGLRGKHGADQTVFVVSDVRDLVSSSSADTSQNVQIVNIFTKNMVCADLFFVFDGVQQLMNVAVHVRAYACVCRWRCGWEFCR